MDKHILAYFFPILAVTAIFLCLFFLITCRSYGNIKNEETAELLMYFDYAEKVWGYLNEKTAEVVIKGKYATVSPFVGNYAVVQESENGKKQIIDKNGKVVLSGNFYSINILVSENGNNHLAILEKKYEKTKFDIGWNFFSSDVKPYFYKEDYYKYRLVNLFDRKTIIPVKENYLPYRIQLIGDYFIAEEGLYQFLDNGGVKLVAKNNIALTVSILENYLEERGINAQVKAVIPDKSFVQSDKIVTIDYGPYVSKQYANPDLNDAFKFLQEADPPFTIPFERHMPLYRDHRLLLNAPLEITERKYLLFFKDKETGRHAVGIYNETNADWELAPYLNNLENGKWERYYVTDIIQTNNPHLFRLYLKTDSSGWDNYNYYRFFGGIFDIVKGEFIEHLFVSDNELSSMPYDSPLRRGDNAGIKFPENGVYVFMDKCRKN